MKYPEYHACSELFPLNARKNRTTKTTQTTREKDCKRLFISFEISKESVNTYRNSPTKNNTKVDTTIKIMPSPTTICFNVIIS
ncbi:hypothetical protein ACQ9BO_09620 [Flavobacterium sp. P21]|uniref:hypothetical protein n=1 Tax=Flavobacterium sp. P21 TaxID=3423948 RepID=UPI003D67F1B1